MTDIAFVPLLALGLVVYTLTNFYKYLMNRQWVSAVTLVAAWVTGVLAVWLVGATEFGHTITIGGAQTLDALSFPGKLLVGLVVTAAGSGIYDLKRSFDNTDSAATPPIIPPKP